MSEEVSTQMLDKLQNIAESMAHAGNAAEICAGIAISMFALQLAGLAVLIVGVLILGFKKGAV